MPWKASNATEHSKKADTPEKKKKWAVIANAALKTYKGNEGKAIATANAAMGDAFWEGSTVFDLAYFVDHMNSVHSEDWGGFDPDDDTLDPDDVDPDDPDDPYYPGDEERMRRHKAASGDDDDDDDDDNDDDDDMAGDWTDSDYRKPFHDARYDREWTAEQRKEATENGEAMPGGGFPIKTKADLAKARQALGRAKNRSAAIAHIKKRAKALGVTLPEGWPNDTSDALPLFVTGGGRHVSYQQSRDGISTVHLTETITLDDKAKVREHDGGYLSAMPRIARTGIQIYGGSEVGMPHMDTVRVYRPPEAVFDRNAIRSYTHMPVTLDHPREMVNADNWSKYAVGETGDEVLRDGNSVRVPMMLRDAKAIKAYRNGTKQLSVGYDCALLWQDGVTEAGEKFDCIQQGIYANHLAVVGAARGGPSLSIGDDDPNGRGAYAMNFRTILVDGLETQVSESAAPMIQRHIQSLEAKVQDAQKKMKQAQEESESTQEDSAKKDSALKAKDKELSDAKKALETKDGELAALKKELDDAKKAASPEALDAMAKDRAAVIQKAKSIVGDKANMDGMSVPEIRRGVVASVLKLGDAAIKEWSDDRITGAFDAMQGGNAFAKSGNGGFTPAFNQQGGFGSLDHARDVFGRPGGGYQQQQDSRAEALRARDAELTQEWRGEQKKLA